MYMKDSLFFIRPFKKVRNIETLVDQCAHVVCSLPQMSFHLILFKLGESFGNQIISAKFDNQPQPNALLNNGP